MGLPLVLTVGSVDQVVLAIDGEVEAIRDHFTSQHAPFTPCHEGHALAVDEADLIVERLAADFGDSAYASHGHSVDQQTEDLGVLVRQMMVFGRLTAFD